MVGRATLSPTQRLLSWVALAATALAAIYVIVSLVPSAEVFAPDWLIVLLFGVPIAFLVFWTFANVARAVLERLRGFRATEGRLDNLPRQWLATWSPLARRVLVVGVPLALLAAGVSLFRLRHGGPSIQDGRYFLFNHGPVHPVSRSTWVELRKDQQRLFMSGATLLWVASAGLVRLGRASDDVIGSD